MEKIIVRYVGGAIGDPKSGEIFGGTKATNYILKKAFEGSKLFDLQMKFRKDFDSIHEVKEYLDGGTVSFLDDTGILNDYYLEGYERPDLLGPLTRSPIKKYGGDWRADYTKEYFYRGKIIRLNEAEEKASTLLRPLKYNHVKKTSLIRHAVHLDELSQSSPGKYVLWAGNKNRPAKNYQMWIEIQKEIEKLGGLPKGYEFKTMSQYAVKDYWSTLKDTAILVNTSKYESYCSAVGEAMAKGVYSIVRKKFNGKFMFLDRPGQIEYDTKEYVEEILRVLKNKEELNKLSKESREYAEKNFSLKTMREDIEKVLMEIINGRN